MKKYCIMLLASTILLSSCSTGAGTGAYAGGSLGSVLGSAIGGIIGGPRGSDIGTVIGMASGAAAGAAIGDAAEKKQREAVMGSDADDQGSRPSRRSRLSQRDREALARRNQRIQRQKTQQRYNNSYNADDYTDDMYVSGSQRSTTQSNKLTDTPLDSEQTPLDSEQTQLDSEQTNESVPETELNTDIVVDTENSGDDRIDFQPSEPTDPTNEQQ